MEQLSFRTDTDEDVDASASIQPLGAENASPAVLNRPLENLRKRTERTREVVNRLAFQVALLPSFIHTAGGGTQDPQDPAEEASVDNATFVWWRGAVPETGPTSGSDNRGKITLTGTGATVGFRMVPLLGPGVYRTSQDEYTVSDVSGRGASVNERLPQRDFVGDGGTIRIVGAALADGGGQIQLRCVRSTASLEAPTVAISGTEGDADDLPVTPGGRVVTVTISRGDAGEGDTVTTIADVIEVLNDDCDFLTASLAAGDDTEDAFTWSLGRLYWPVPGLELFISQSTLSSFFAASEDNLLREGDTLAIYFETVADLLGSGTSSAGCNIGVGQLVNVTRAGEAFSADAVLIPVARVIDNRLHLPGGATLTTEMSFTPTAELSARTLYAGLSGMGDGTFFGQTLVDSESVQIFLGRMAQGAQALVSGSASLDYLGVGIANASGAGDSAVAGARAVVRETQASSPVPAVGSRVVLRKDVAAAADGTLEEVGAVYATLRDGGGKSGVAGVLRAAYVGGQLVWQLATNPVTNLGTAIDSAAGAFFGYDSSLVRHYLRTGRGVFGTIADTFTGHNNGSAGDDATLIRAQGTVTTTAHIDPAPSVDVINTDGPSLAAEFKGASMLRFLRGKIGSAGALIEGAVLRVSQRLGDQSRVDLFVNDGSNDSARVQDPALTIVAADDDWPARVDIYGVAHRCVARGIFYQAGTNDPVLHSGAGFGNPSRSTTGVYVFPVPALEAAGEIDTLQAYARVTLLDGTRAISSGSDTFYIAQTTMTDTPSMAAVAAMASVVAGNVTHLDDWGDASNPGFAVEVFLSGPIT